MSERFIGSSFLVILRYGLERALPEVCYASMHYA